MASPSMLRAEIVAYLDNLLNIAAIPDYGPQGLQVEGRAEVHRVAVAVDVAHAAIDGALAAGADLLIVHHGLFWGEARRLVGAFGHKVRRLLTADLNLYAAHLALDLHPTLGNNAELCRLLGLRPVGTYYPYKGVDVGLVAEPVGTMTFDALLAAFTAALQPPLRVTAFGPEVVKRVAVCSGDAGRTLEAAHAQGCDTLVTGETDYTVAHLAEELGMNVLYGGHYATETLGVQALARHLQDQFGLPWGFVDVPVNL
ncbi:MAG: Nif3-like dinuclear metal center hexameric protein [Caldilineales bacterium]|nr:Nif3-like dinuclear metal center hexameric protein [Caldilineales bacterium]